MAMDQIYIVEGRELAFCGAGYKQIGVITMAVPDAKEAHTVDARVQRRRLLARTRS